MNQHTNHNDDPYEPIPIFVDKPEPRTNRVQASFQKSEIQKPRSAFNLFFRKLVDNTLGFPPISPNLTSSIETTTEHEQQNILNQRNLLLTLRRRGKLCFQELARIISKRWDNIDPITYTHYTNMATLEKIRYLREKEAERQQHFLPVVTPSEVQRFTFQSPDFARMPSSTIPIVQALETPKVLTDTNDSYNSAPKPYAQLSENPIRPLSGTMSEPCDGSFSSLARSLDPDSIDLIVKAFK